MLDPRIYRMGLVPVVFAVIVLAFSLGDQQGALPTNLAPDAYAGGNAWHTMNTLAQAYPRRRPGSYGDGKVADYVAHRLAGDRLAVSRDFFRAQTVDGPRTLENVVGVLAGIGRGTIVIVSHRDALSAPARAELSGTAVMLELARVLAGETQQHTIVLASISGAVGAEGAARLSRQLPQPVDAVLVLGDLAGTQVHRPAISPWSDGQDLAPPALRNTVAAALSGEAGLQAGGNGLGGQIAHLAFPMSSSEQAPFNASSEPAVLLSLFGEGAPPANEPVSFNQIAATGRAVLRALNALDGAPPVPAPSSYLIWSGKIVPAWAVSVLVLALIVPVLAATVDGAARARRRGHPILSWIAWVLSGALPFLLAALLVAFAHLVGLIGFAPAIPVHGGAVPLGGSGTTALILVAIVVVAGLVWLRRWVIALAGPGAASRGDPLPGAASALMLVMCAVALLVWLANPFAALLLVPALHMWLWVVVPDVRLPAPVLTLLVIGGLALPGLVIAYYAIVLGLGGVGVAWSWMLEASGGAVGWPLVIEWSAFAGCAVSVVAIALQRARAPRPEPVAVTVRGPHTYAGPGSLGGTESALRR